MNTEPRIPIDYDKIKAFCEKWKIIEFSLFGSVLTDEFRPDSDVDVMIRFAADSRWRLVHWIQIEDELKGILGRDVDILSRPDVERMTNYIRRKSIMRGSRVLYAQ